MRAPLRKLPKALSSLGVGGFVPNRVAPFCLSSLVLAGAGPLALISFLHNHTHTRSLMGCIVKFNCAFVFYVISQGFEVFGGWC